MSCTVPQLGEVSGGPQIHSPETMPVRAALLTNCIPPYWTSTFSNLAERLREFQIFLSTPMEANRDWKPEWGDLRVTVQRCWTYAALRRHDLGFKDEVWRHFPYDTLPLLWRHRPDVVISAQLGFRTLQAAIYRKLFPKTRLIVWAPMSEHCEKGVSSLRRLQRKLLLCAADAVLVNGASGRKYLASIGAPSRKIFPLPYCAEIQPHLLRPIERNPATARRLLYVGQLVDRKGLAPFLELLADWSQRHPDTQVDFWIAGEGPLRAELEEFPKPRQLKVRFLGSVAYEKLPDVYALGGILVFPTLADEWGVVVNEALAAGLPVLGSRYSQAVEELVTEEETGWTFRPDRRDEAYAALDRAMNAPDAQIEKMRRMARKRIQLLRPEFGAECFLRAIRYVWQPGQTILG